MGHWIILECLEVNICVSNDLKEHHGAITWSIMGICMLVILIGGSGCCNPTRSFPVPTLLCVILWEWLLYIRIHVSLWQILTSSHSKFIQWPTQDILYLSIVNYILIELQMCSPDESPTRLWSRVPSIQDSLWHISNIWWHMLHVVHVYAGTRTYLYYVWKSFVRRH